MRASLGLALVLSIAGASCERPAPTCPILFEDAASRDAANADASRPARVLIYSRTTAFRHDSIPAAVAAVRAIATAEGLEVEASEELSAITADNLRRFAAIVAISPTGEPFGADDSPSVRALIAFVEDGGGWLGLHAVGDAYPCGRYPSFVGATFRSHPGDTRAARCFAFGSHPAVDRLPSPFTLTDEVHVFHNFRRDNQVVLACDALDGVAVVPVAWHRAVGDGRLFVSALGHPIALWSDPVFLSDHVRPALRWVLRRE
jgi:type 1 glutamine amidotransferase